MSVLSEPSEAAAAPEVLEALPGRAGRWSRWRRFMPVLPVAVFLAVVAMPLYNDSSVWLRQIELISITAMVVIGLNLTWGFAGELALGQAAMYAAGAYVTGALAIGGHNEILLALPLSMVAAGLVGLISGVPGLRLGGWGLAMLSFFLILLIPDVVNLLPQYTGGFAGLSGIPQMVILGHQADATAYYMVVVVVTAIVFAALRNLIVSRHGAAFRVLKQSPVLASSLGIPVYRTKVTAYVLGALPAGIAGSLFSYLDGFISPETFSFSTTVAFLGASILGGAGSVYGAFVGSALLQLGPLRTTAFQKYALIAYGLFLIFGGILFSDGVTGLVRTVVNRLRPKRAASSARSGRSKSFDLGSFAGRRLEVSKVSKRFGGNVALAKVSLDADPGQITAIIGSNGSGKTTLLNLISGFYRLDEGSLKLGDEELGGRPPHRIAASGVGRTFQTPAVPSGLSAAEVVATARYASARVGMLAAVLRLPRFLRVRSDDRKEALRLLTLLDIDHLADIEAASLPLGTRRLLEVARALAMRPVLLLLDEPASGLDHEDILEFAKAVRRIRDAGATVVLIEHNFPLVLQLADRIHVLQRGVLIASGTPAEISADKDVAESYLGAQT